MPVTIYVIEYYLLLACVDVLCNIAEFSFVRHLFDVSNQILLIYIVKGSWGIHSGKCNFELIDRSYGITTNVMY
jgi:hypothetical protein